MTDLAKDIEILNNDKKKYTMIVMTQTGIIASATKDKKQNIDVKTNRTKILTSTGIISSATKEKKNIEEIIISLKGSMDQC